MAHFVGIDLGQTHDYTAIAVLEREDVADGPPAFDLRHLHRFSLGTPYPKIVDAIRELCRQPALQGARVAVDQTGVGRPVVDMLRERLADVGCTLLPITITAGRQIKVVPGDGIRVPKKVLVGVVGTLLQSNRLRIAKTLPDAPALIKELAKFRIKITAARHEVFEAGGSGKNDDLVVATALAAWLGSQAERQLP